jgi:hypothetical protein
MMIGVLLIVALHAYSVRLPASAGLRGVRCGAGVVFDEISLLGVCCSLRRLPETRQPGATVLLSSIVFAVLLILNAFPYT